MGLIVDKNLSNGLTVPNVYCRIDTVMGSKKEIEYSVTAYISRNAFLDNKLPITNQEIYSFVPDVSRKSDNFIKQAFDDLKKREGYSNGTDVFEEGQ